ncbi:Hypothetical predicted protein [Xyrichtys novacula]|uniref:Uncharacterized protein n=1 Tax=Xyrichtys novacula TaxID=13765 RepID=A0AAV1F460_XYRNO|nr:Hypothetical predicted protein [Xyrichtys novacula]
MMQCPAINTFVKEFLLPKRAPLHGRRKKSIFSCPISQQGLESIGYFMSHGWAHTDRENTNLSVRPDNHFKPTSIFSKSILHPGSQPKKQTPPVHSGTLDLKQSGTSQLLITKGKLAPKNKNGILFLLLFFRASRGSALWDLRFGTQKVLCRAKYCEAFNEPTDFCCILSV